MMNVVRANTPQVADPVFRRRVTIVRRRQEANERLMRFYFVEEPVFNERMFRKRYRMHRPLFLKITGDLEQEYVYFQQRYDSAGKLGFTAIQKCTAALRQITYGSSVDSFDENLEMSERTMRESLAHFCKGTILYLISIIS